MGTMAGKVERRDAGDDTERLAYGPAIDAGAHLLGVLAFEQLRDAGGELDDLEPARGFAFRVGKDLAVLAVDGGGYVIEAALKDFAEAKEHARAAQRRP